MAEEFKYWAFISYSHQDNLVARQNGQTACLRWAEWLHQALETYRTPAIFRQRFAPTGEPMPDRFFPIFQDEKELPLNPDLAHAIQRALLQSRFLIVVCSPRSAGSFYVNEEVRLFKQLGRQDRILALIVAGEPNAGEGNKPGFALNEECFCPALRHPLDTEGKIDLTRRDAQEPIAGDVRVKDQQVAREALRSDLPAHRPVLEYMKLKLLAGLMGVGFDELVHRDRARQAAEMRRRIGILSAVTLAIGLLAVYALIERNRATAEANRANQSERRIAENASRSHYDLAKLLLERNDTGAALAHLAEALRNNPQNRVATSFALNLLLHREWPLPEPSPLGDGVALMAAAISPDGRRLLTWPGKETLFLWDAKTGQALAPPLSTGQEIIGASFSWDSERLLSTSRDGFARLWDAGTGQERARFAIPEKLPALWFSDEKRLVTLAPNAAQIWETATAQPLTAALPHPNLGLVESSVDGARLLTGSNDGLIQVWDTARGAALGQPIRHGDLLFAITFSPDGERVFSGASDGFLRAWDANTGAAVGAVNQTDPPWFIRASSAGERLLSRGTDGRLHLWKTTSLEPWCEPIVSEGFGLSANLSVDGTRLLLPVKGRLKVWNVATGRQLAEPVVRQILLTGASLSPDETRVVTAAWENAARVWDATDGKRLIGPLKHTNPVTYAEFSPDGRRLVSSSWDGTVQVWDATSGAALGAPVKLSGRVNRAVFSPNGASIAAATSEGEVRIFDSASGVTLQTLAKTRGEVYTLAFSPDGQQLVTGGGDFVGRVWDVATGKALVAKIKHASSLSSASFSPDSRRILTASSDRSARIWDAETGAPLIDEVRHNEWINSARFNSTGDRFVTAAKDGVVRVWESASGQPLASFGPLSGKLTLGVEALSAAFSRDDRSIHVVLPGAVQRLEVAGWDVATEELAALLDCLGGRHFNATDGRMVGVEPDQFSAVRGRLLQASGQGEVARVRRWFLAERTQRPLAPGRSMTLSQWTARRLADEVPDASVEMLEEILLANPRDPVLLRTLATKLREKAPARARHFLRLSRLLDPQISLSEELETLLQTIP